MSDTDHWGYEVHYRASGTDELGRPNKASEWVKASEVTVTDGVVRFQDDEGTDVVGCDADAIVGYDAVTVEDRARHEQIRRKASQIDWDEMGDSS